MYFSTKSYVMGPQKDRLDEMGFFEPKTYDGYKNNHIFMLKKFAYRDLCLNFAILNLCTVYVRTSIISWTLSGFAPA